MTRTSILFFLVFVLGFAAAARADDPFTVSGISVDASASSATEAQTIAINSGRGRAWTALFHRLAKAQDWPRQPVLDDLTLQRIIRSYLPGNERRSTTRYVASMTYAFNPDAVRRILRQNNIAYADVQAHPVLVIPMAPGYQPRGAWSAAWANPKFSGGSVPLVIPRGDAVDVSALGQLNFTTSAWQDVEPTCSRLHALEAYLALVQPGNGQIVVKLRRLGPGNSPPIPDVTTPIPSKTPPGKGLAVAADMSAGAIIDAWKARAAIDFGKRSKLLAEVHIESLNDWSTMQQKLAAVPTISEVAIIGMNVGEARIAISYAGTSEQLTQLLGQSGFDLSNDEGTWWLSEKSANADAAGQ